MSGGTARALTLVVAVVWAGLAMTGGPAYAHNTLLESDPEDGEEYAHAPEEVRLRFAEPVGANSTELTATGPDGSSVLAGEAEFDGTEVTVPIAPGPAGEYLIAYELVSQDGDPVSGEVEFSVTVGEPTPTPSPTPAAPTTATAAPASATPGDSSSQWWPWLVAAVAVVGIAIAGFLVVRRRSTTR